MLRAESDTAARLRKSHTEMSKSMSQLEGLNREMQEKSRAADNTKLALEKEVLQLQSTLDSERRNCSQGSEEIRELQGNRPPSHPLPSPHNLNDTKELNFCHGRCSRVSPHRVKA